MTTDTDTDKNPRAEYWATVESIAREALDAEKEGNDASDFIHESVDSSYYVIYAHANLVPLQEGDNESAAFDEMGDDALSGCESYGDVTQRLAYWAMRSDCEAELTELRDEAEKAAESEA